VLYGVQPVVIAVVVQAIYGLAKPALKTPLLWATALAAIAGYWFGVNELLLLFGIAGLAFLASRVTSKTALLEPVSSSATFVGYMIAGVPGAVLATVGIFAPAFAFVYFTHPLLSSLRAQTWTARLLDAVNAAALGLMVAVVLQLARAALTDLPTILIALASSVVLVRFKVNATWVLLAGGLIGFALRG